MQPQRRLPLPPPPPPPPCSQPADGTNTTLSCQQKMVITLSVDSGDNLVTQELQLGMACIGR